jgi:hypothetical protein
LRLFQNGKDVKSGKDKKELSTFSNQVPFFKKDEKYPKK